MNPAPAEPRRARGPAGRHTALQAAAKLGCILLLLLATPGCFTAGKERPQGATSVEAGSEEAAPGKAASGEAAPGEAASGEAGSEEAAPTGAVAGTDPGAAASEPALPEPLRLALVPEEVRPGEPFVAAFWAAGDGAAGNYRAVLLNRHGERIAKAAFFSLDGDMPELLAAALAAPSTALPGEALVRLERDGTALGEAILRIAGREFTAEEIALDRRNTDIRTLPDPQKTLESEQLSAIIYFTGTDIFAPGAFTPPVSSTRRTSFYGDRRVYRYATGGSDTAIHAGIDYGVPTGTEVRACAAGKVILARFRIATGYSVVLEHLPGVYSIYYHLDNIQVGEGAMTNAGDLLGESGSTGLATGPHLHWEIRVSGENADPDAFIGRALLDKDAILSKLNG